MAAPWVLLSDMMDIMDAEAASTTGAAVGGEGYELIGCWAGSLMAQDEAPVGGTSERVAEARHPHQIAESVKLVAHLAKPPEVTCFALILSGQRRRESEKLRTLYLSSADRELLLMYAGPLAPNWMSPGYYLIHDAAEGSLTVIPEMPLTIEDKTSGAECCRAAILRCCCHGGGEDQGAWIVAELMVTHGTPPEFTLWRSSSSSASGSSQWVRTLPRVPTGVSPFEFLVDKAFSFRGSYMCWVDLRKGILICNVSDEDPDFGFIPLPQGCSSDVPIYERGRPVDYRTMGCCNDSIKFVSIDGLLDGPPITLSVWILEKLDPVEWIKVTELCFEQLWADGLYRSLMMPRWVPMFPTLNPYEDGVVYFIINGFCSRYMDLDVDIGSNEYVFGLDTQSGKVVCHSGGCSRTGLSGGMLVPCLFPQLSRKR